MEWADILCRVDHTLLKPEARWRDICQVVDEGARYGCASVCIPPSFVSRAAQYAGGRVRICTVIGFPNGASTTAVKCAEAQDAVNNGAQEIDMVVNLGDVKNGDFDAVEKEIEALKKAAGDNVLKVIVETCYLTQEEKIRLCECVTKAGADYIKTSTGFGTAGATLEDIALFRAHIGPQVKVKAAGGIRTREDLEAFCNAGCDRLGCSAAVKVLCEKG